MDALYASQGDKIKEARLQQLVQSLASRRLPETSDVTLVCGSREFYAHKVVLEATSPYFVAMFNSGFNEAVSRKLELPKMEPETVEAILEFIYLGEVNKIKSEEDIKKVLAESHMMQLKEIFEYCCSALEESITMANYFEIWAIASTYDNISLKERVMHFSLAHFGEIKTTDEFLLLSEDQIKSFIAFCKGKRRNLDAVLESVIKWLLYDLQGREKTARGLISSIDVKLLTEEHIKLLLQNHVFRNASEEIANRINEVAATLFVTHKCRARKCRLQHLPMPPVPTPKVSYVQRIQSIMDPNLSFRGCSEPNYPSLYLNFQVDELPELKADSVKKERIQQLALSIKALRVAESSDIVIVCGDQEFFAHKVVLEASSQYFVTMFNAGLRGSKSGRITFTEVHPEIMDAILEYIYLGEVKNLQSEEKIKKVLGHAHVMLLKDLFSYCCEALEVSVSVGNLFELWQIGLKYDYKSLTSKVMDFALVHFDKVEDLNDFCLVSPDQLRQLLKFSEDKVACLDQMLKFLVKWLIYDTANREVLASELFTCIDVKLVSKTFVQSLVRNPEVMKSSTEIMNRINELSVEILLSGSNISASQPLLKPIELSE